MEYTVNQLADIAGVSKRTLRYYDEIGLLKQKFINESGYRIYSDNEIDLLQQILFYRSMDMKLNEIKEIILSPNYNVEDALEEQRVKLLEKRKQIDLILSNIEKTISHRKGEIKMTNHEKFEGFKKDKIQENEKSYGKEIREKYGDDEIEKSNQKFMNLSKEEYQRMLQTEEELITALKEVMNTNDLDSEVAKTVFEKHKGWLSFTWSFYSKEAHINLASMYVEDERFRSYYEDKAGIGAAEVLYKII